MRPPLGQFRNASVPILLSVCAVAGLIVALQSTVRVSRLIASTRGYVVAMNDALLFVDGLLDARLESPVVPNEPAELLSYWRELIHRGNARLDRLASASASLWMGERLQSMVRRLEGSHHEQADFAESSVVYLQRLLATEQGAEILSRGLQSYGAQLRVQREMNPEALTNMVLLQRSLGGLSIAGRATLRQSVELFQESDRVQDRSIAIFIGGCGLTALAWAILIRRLGRVERKNRTLRQEAIALYHAETVAALEQAVRAHDPEMIAAAVKRAFGTHEVCAVLLSVRARSGTGRFWESPHAPAALTVLTVPLGDNVFHLVGTADHRQSANVARAVGDWLDPHPRDWITLWTAPVGRNDVAAAIALLELRAVDVYRFRAGSMVGVADEPLHSNEPPAGPVLRRMKNRTEAIVHLRRLLLKNRVPEARAVIADVLVQTGDISRVAYQLSSSAIADVLLELAPTILRRDYHGRFSALIARAAGQPTIDSALAQYHAALAIIAQQESTVPPALKVLLSRIKTTVAANIQDPALCADFVSDRLHYSTGHLNRTFKQHEGISIREYINRARVTRVSELLDDGTATSVKQAFSQVGVTNHTHFYQVFRRITGMNPSAFGRRSGKDGSVGAHGQDLERPNGHVSRPHA